MKRAERVVITGAASGIGAATARRYAGRGAEVIGLDIDEDALDAVMGDCRTRARHACGYRCDVADSGAVAEIADRVARERGPVDVLVNNAGVGVAGSFLDTTADDWTWLRSINLDGVVHCCRAFGAAMVERGRGQVVNVASGAGYIPNHRMATYCASKAAVIMLSRCLRADWAGRGVGVSVVCPGVIRTPILEHTRLRGAAAGEKDRIARAFKLGHSPDAVAKAIMNAAAHNWSLVPVGIEAKVAYHALRALPVPVGNLLARV